MDIFHRYVDVVKEITVELNRIATAHKDHDLFLQIFAQKCEKQLEFNRWFPNHYIPLFQIIDRFTRFCFRYFDKHWVFERKTA